jgi:hypothetical protein
MADEFMADEFLANVCADVAFAMKRWVVGPYRVRRVRLYGVGLGKSGTHSIANMFSRGVRACHEPQVAQLIDKVIEWRRGLVSDQEMCAWLQDRDRELALEVDSSGMNQQIAGLLLREFPNARFVLSLRDCYSWTNSGMNWYLNSNGSGPWSKWWSFLYGNGPFNYAPEERVLKDKGIPPLDTYFSSWATRNANTLASLPSDRLLIVRTDQIRQRAYEIADFAGLPRRVIRLHRTHEFHNRKKVAILHELDRRFLESKVEQHCRPLMSRFFPEIKSIDDARL